MRSQKMKNIGAISGLIGFSFLTGCINLTPDVVMPVGQVSAIDRSQLADPNAPVKSTVRTAQSGEMLYSQPVNHEFVLVLQNTPEAASDFGNAFQDRELEAKAGQKFYPVVTLGQVRSISACSFDRPILAIPKLAEGNKGYLKMCFQMAELPEKFKVETIDLDGIDWVSSEFFEVVESIGSTNRSSFQSLSRWEPQKIHKTKEPARFTRQTSVMPTGDQGRTSALRFIVSPTGPQLETAYMAGTEPRKTTADPVPIDVDKGFPQTLEFAGGNVELLALTDGVLAYRVISSTPQRRIVMDLE